MRRRTNARRSRALQVTAGAVGICCQKTDEAAVFVAAGITDVLVTNEVVAPAKIERLAALARDATIGVLVDDAANVMALGDAATRAGVTLDVYVEIDVGAHRCGVAPLAPAAELAQRIAVSPGLRFRGLHAYHGGAQHLREPEAREAAIAAAAELARDTRDLIEDAGLHCAIVTGAGTGTWRHERDSGIWNELQPGSYVFMDADYQRNTSQPGRDALRAEPVRAGRRDERRGARARGRRCGPQGLRVRFGFARRARSRRARAYVKASDEHGVLELAADAAPIARNDRVWLVPGHCDPTVNLYDWIVGVRGGRVECVWSVAARGTLG